MYQDYVGMITSRPDRVEVIEEALKASRSPLSLVGFLGALKKLFAHTQPANELQAVEIAGRIAATGLNPTPGTDQIIVVRNERGFEVIITYKGYNTLLARAGYVLVAETVKEGDGFEIRLGTDPEITHTPLIEGAGSVRAAYAIATRKDGRYFAFVRKEELEAVRAKAVGVAAEAWNMFPEVMAKKTAIRRLFQTAPVELVPVGAIEYFGDEGGEQQPTTALSNPAAQRADLNRFLAD